MEPEPELELEPEPELDELEPELPPEPESGAPGTHAPPMQWVAAGQGLPQIPQLLESDWRLLHPVAQQVWPAAHAAPPQTQLPPAQSSFRGHLLPHAPQLKGSAATFVHVLPQQSSPAAHRVAPQVTAPLQPYVTLDPTTLFAHVAPMALQFAPHAPQFGSPVVLTHVPLQQVGLVESQSDDVVQLPLGELPLHPPAERRSPRGACVRRITSTTPTTGDDSARRTNRSSNEPSDLIRKDYAHPIDAQG